MSSRGHIGRSAIGIPQSLRTQIAMGGLSLALGAAIGYSLASASPEAHLPTAAPASYGISHEEFLRLNTTALEALTPSLGASTSPETADRGFLYWNTVALDALGTPVVAASPVSKVRDAFLYWNVESFERPGTPLADRPGFPR